MYTISKQLFLSTIFFHLFNVILFKSPNRTEIPLPASGKMFVVVRAPSICYP